MRALILVFITGLSCKTKEINPTYPMWEYERLTPPNGVKVEENVFIDRSEISNAAYKEFLYDIGLEYPKESREKELEHLIIDTTVWGKNYTCLGSLQCTYFQERKTEGFPLVGVTYKQAIIFSNWRTNKVFEMMLLKNKIIDLDTSRKFTVDLFFKEILPTLDLKEPITKYVEYRLPTYSEYTKAISYSDNLTLANLKGKKKGVKRKVLKTCLSFFPLFNAEIEPCNEDSIEFYPTVNRFVACDNESNPNIIYDLRGNVAEMSVNGLSSYGGGWVNTRKNILEGDTLIFSEANSWTGFRNVASWKEWDNTKKE